MWKHRLIFVSMWGIVTVSLFLFPGFEARGLAMGMVIGYWPALISKSIYESQHHYPIAFLFMMLILSGATVGLLSWLMDYAKISKKIWIFCATIILCLSAVFFAYGLNFEEWKNTPAVVSATEANGQPNRIDFYKEIVIPRTLVGGLWGLYVAGGLCALYAIAKLIKKKFLTRQIEATANAVPHL